MSMEGSSQAAVAPDFDVYGAMDWQDGVGTLPGSQLKFRVNEFGVLEVVTDEVKEDAEEEEEGVRKAHATTTWVVPSSHEENIQIKEEEERPDKERTDKEKVEVGLWGLVCVRCNRKGSSVDFLSDGRHCSQRCLQQDQQGEARTKNEESLSNGQLLGVGRRRTSQPERILEKMDTSPDQPDDDDDEDYEEKESKRPGTRGAPRGRRKRRGDAALLRHTVPYGGKKKVWCWASYLEQERAVAAPNKLFKEHQAFPQSKNGFRVGMRLEGVDPEHPSMYCVLSVAEVSGHRIRLHFDKFSDCYDFWVNSNSSDIHPIGWCEKTGHKLHPPKGVKEQDFSWPAYIKQWKAQAAPKALFDNHNTTVTPQGFRIGMKLEAIDKKNPSFICVATVTDMVDSRFLVHFDNWDESYDYWCDATSPYIHPVSWCQENNRILTPPPGYPSVKKFSWEKYLEETSSSAAPARAFKQKPPHGFQRQQRLEVVDRRNPQLVRVATVTDTDDHRILVHFDGWPEELDYWVDTDSPDLHPAGWCAKTGHLLQPPICLQEVLESSEQGGCPTPGCKGIGHIKGARYSGHHSAVGCPYSDINLNRDSSLPDRLSGEMPGSRLARTRRAEPPLPNTPPTNTDVGTLATSMEPPIKRPAGTEPKRRVGRPCKQRKVEEEEVESEVSSITETKELTLQQALHQSVFLPSPTPTPSLSPTPSPSMPFCWDQHSKLLPTVEGITASKVAAWTVEQVSEFIQGLPGCKEHIRTFREEQIDGEALLLLNQVDLLRILGIKLGPAIKIYNSILMFRTAEERACNEL
ncbi:lethal(3)malignant brain tumor-like protein 3 isoform X2 [Osmerus eperlanus]